MTAEQLVAIVTNLGWTLVAWVLVLLVEIRIFLGRLRRSGVRGSAFELRRKWKAEIGLLAAFLVVFLAITSEAASTKPGRSLVLALIVPVVIAGAAAEVCWAVSKKEGAAALAMGEIRRRNAGSPRKTSRDRLRSRSRPLARDR